jgi:hypothetical protein
LFGGLKKVSFVPMSINKPIVKSVKYNWHAVGSTLDRDGAGEDWTRIEVGQDGVTSIIESEPCNGLQMWNYTAFKGNDPCCRIFNPNFVEYFPLPREA